MDHIDQMQILRNEIGLQAYAQRDPVVEYRREGFELFDNMISKIKEDTVAFLLNAKIEINRVNQPVEPKKEFPRAEVVQPQKTVVNDKKEVGRNEPCPCGSGKKYKNCCGKQ